MDVSEIARMRLDTTIAEFNALRQEIIHRSGSQHGLMSLGMTIAVGLAGFAFAETEGLLRAELLLLIPLAVLPLGLLWLDHHRAISRMGLYIKVNHRASVIRALAAAGYDRDTDALMRWEWESCRKPEKGERRHTLRFALPQMFAFLLPAAAGWAAGVAFLLWRSGNEPDREWAIGSAAIGFFLLAWSACDWKWAFSGRVRVQANPDAIPPASQEIGSLPALDEVEEARYLGRVWDFNPPKVPDAMDQEPDG